MRVPVLLENKIFVSVILYRVAMGVKQGGPPVADRATALIAVFGITNITAWDLELPATTPKDYVRPFQTISVVLIRRIAEVNDHGIVQHGAIALWDSH